MTLVFLLGGKGQRFLDAGYTIPKPLIPARGRPILWHVLAHYPSGLGRMVFVIRRDLINAGLPSVLPSHSYIHILPRETSGPLETMLWSEDTWRGPQELLMCDGDSYFENPRELLRALKTWRDTRADGGVTVRRCESPTCSYGRYEDGWITETRERDPFTAWSTTGPYWWKSADVFFHHASLAHQSGIHSISPIYNFLLHAGGTVRGVQVKSFLHLGTPEDLTAWNHR